MLDKFYKSFKVFICFFLIFNTTLLSLSLDSKADTITGDLVGTGTGSATVEALRKILGDTGLAQLGIIVGGSYVMAKNDEYIVEPFIDLVKSGVQALTPDTLTGVLDGFKFKNTGVSEFVLNAKGIESILNFMISKNDTSVEIFKPSEIINTSSTSFYSTAYDSTTYNSWTVKQVLCSFTPSVVTNVSCNVGGSPLSQYHSVGATLQPGNTYYLLLVNFSNYSGICFSTSQSYDDVFSYTTFCTSRNYNTYSFDVSASQGIDIGIPSTSIDYTYPSDFSKYNSINDYNSAYNAYTGSPSICVDWDKLLKDQDLTNLKNIDDVIGALEGVIGSPGGVDVIGQSISLEYDGVVVPDTPEVSEDDSNPSLLKKLMDWLFDLFKKLAELLEKLLQKLLEGLKDLLLSLFVPSDAFLQDKVDILKSNLEPKLPYTQFIELFNYEYESSSLQDIYINWQGQDICIVKVTLFEKFRSIFNLGVYAVTFFLLAVYNYNNIYKLIRGTDYVSATNTVKNMSDKGSEDK